jgi:hypothetical protein
MSKNTKKSEDLKILMSELAEKRYGLLLRGVQIGLKQVGIDNVFISMPKVEDDRLVFHVERDVEKQG